jgi:hypothetical protein
MFLADLKHSMLSCEYNFPSFAARVSNEAMLAEDRFESFFSVSPSFLMASENSDGEQNLSKEQPVTPTKNSSNISK